MVDKRCNVSTPFNGERAILTLSVSAGEVSSIMSAYRWTEIILHINDNQCWTETILASPKKVKIVHRDENLILAFQIA